MGELWGYKYTPMPTYIYMLCVIMLLNVHIHSGTCSMCTMHVFSIVKTEILVH